jgi:tetratricopeptide (TPR) repeat protein
MRRDDPAEAMFRELLPLHEKALGGEHPDTLATRNNLARAINAQGRSAEAEAMYRELLPLLEKVLGGAHHNTLRARGNLAWTINAQGRSAEAEAMWRELLPLLEKVLGGEHPDTLTTRNNLAWAIKAQDLSAQAEKMLPAELRPAVAKDQPHTRTAETSLTQSPDVRNSDDSSGARGGTQRLAGGVCNS